MFLELLEDKANSSHLRLVGPPVSPVFCSVYCFPNAIDRFRGLQVVVVVHCCWAKPNLKRRRKTAVVQFGANWSRLLRNAATTPARNCGKNCDAAWPKSAGACCDCDLGPWPELFPTESRASDVSCETYLLDHLDHGFVGYLLQWKECKGLSWLFLQKT